VVTVKAPLPARVRGFTAIEVMVVVAIVGIIAAIAAPNMADMVRVQRVRSAAFDIVSAITLARSEALKRNTTVTITPTGGDWVQGWTTKDFNGNVLQTQQAFSCTTCHFTGAADITFTAAGRLPIGSGTKQIAVIDDKLDAAKYRCIDVDLSGRAVTKQGVCV
jgi:type IV fimbrial biogenesis protein FimT